MADTPPFPQKPGIRTPERRAEVAWFAALCGEDHEFLDAPDSRLRSRYEHCGEIVRRADARGYQSILLPTSWNPGQDPVAFASPNSASTKASAA